MTQDQLLIAILAGVGVLTLIAFLIFKKKKPQKSITAEPTKAIEPSPEVPVITETVKPQLVDLETALSSTKNHLFGRLKDVFSKTDRLSSDDMESLEEVLYTSDLGPKTVQRLVEAVGEKLDSQEKSDLDKVRGALKDEMLDIFEGQSQEINEIDQFLKTSTEKNKPLIWMIVGVNGVGKTTTIGKLAQKAKSAGLKTLVVAGDTFRAAAEDQLKVWSERAQVEIFSPEGVKDPSAVAYDGLNMAKSQEFDLVILDTAGRLHTQSNLMEELKKMKRVMTKVIPDAPHETFLVLDANSGQNALMQAKSFHEALDLTGVILTKLDGTAKGGVAVGLVCELGLPIKLIGVGEGIDDLRPFHSQEFVNSII